jgi:thiol:disulfide interchange protein DsbD
VRLVVPQWVLLATMGVVELVGAAVFGIFEAADGFLAQIRKGFAILLLVLGILHSIRANEVVFDLQILSRGAATAVKEEHAGWLEQDLEGALAKAKAEHKVVVVDIYAEWCAQCKELDEKTWPDAAVKQWLAQNAVAIRIDTDARRKDLATKLQINGYPTVILLDGEGKELRRSLGFQNPETTLTWLKASVPAR